MKLNQKKKLKRKNKKRRVFFKNNLSPGDILMLTAAVRDLKLSYPDIEIAVSTTCPEIWDNNPNIIKMNEKDKDVEVYDIEYPLVHNSNDGQYHFIHGFRKHIEEKLDLKIEPTVFKGDIYINDEEKSWMSQIEEMGIKDKFWIVVAGGKYDFTAKWWSPLFFQEVVDHFKGKITFVQCGVKDHWHLPLENVINLVGKTNLRQFIRLIYHSVGILSPVTFAMHAAAAVESKHGLKNRPCVVLAGGREPSQWEKYPHHRFLETNGALGCCDSGGCWRSRCHKVGDGDKKDRDEELCFFPVQVENDISIPKCMHMIKPKDVIRSIEMYYDGGILEYGSTIN
jgi:ADP-heptose:LPS heptosyltransferase